MGCRSERCGGKRYVISNLCKMNILMKASDSAVSPSVIMSRGCVVDKSDTDITCAKWRKMCLTKTVTYSFNFLHIM